MFKKPHTNLVHWKLVITFSYILFWIIHFTSSLLLWCSFYTSSKTKRSLCHVRFIYIKYSHTNTNAKRDIQTTVCICWPLPSLHWLSRLLLIYEDRCGDDFIHAERSKQAELKCIAEKKHYCEMFHHFRVLCVQHTAQAYHQTERANDRLLPSLLSHISCDLVFF